VARSAGQGNDGGGRPGTHGGEVAEVAFQQLFADGPRRHRIIKMPAVDHRIGRNQLSAGSGRQHGAVVADAERRRRRNVTEPAADAGDQPRLAEGGDRIVETLREGRHRRVRGRVVVREE
jgi:hypothetical protein